MSSKVRKVNFTKTDIGLGNVPNVDATNPANITQSASYRFATDTEKSTWGAKADTADIDSAIAAVPNLTAIIVHEGNVVTHEGEVVWVS